MEADGTRILELLRGQNPSVPMTNWSVIKMETLLQNSITMLKAISEKKTDCKNFFFGVREEKVKVFRPKTPDDDDADGIDSANQLLDKIQLDGPSNSKTPNDT